MDGGVYGDLELGVCEAGGEVAGVWEVVGGGGRLGRRGWRRGDAGGVYVAAVLGRFIEVVVFFGDGSGWLVVRIVRFIV